MDSLAQALDVPRERIIEFWLHRTRRGRSIITVRFDATDVAGPPITRVYEMTEVPDERHPLPGVLTADRLDTATSQIPSGKPRRRFLRGRRNG